MPRIVSGKFGGRVLVAPKGSATRPTQDRTKEALFSILGNISGMSAIDLFAGTGSLGLEALSRGADPVAFVELAKAPLDALEANIKTLGVEDNTIVYSCMVEEALSRLRPADLILMDPPYAYAATDEIIEDIFSRGLLLPKGTLVVETSAKRVLRVPEGVTMRSERRYGDSKLVLFTL
jgi:16S rRNA (guanine966-N2)-methyltransferase